MFSTRKATESANSRLFGKWKSPRPKPGGFFAWRGASPKAGVILFLADRILDPTNDKIQLDTVFKAARALGREVELAPLRQALIDGEKRGDAGELDMNDIESKARRRAKSAS